MTLKICTQRKNPGKPSASLFNKNFPKNAEIKMCLINEQV